MPIDRYVFPPSKLENGADVTAGHPIPDTLVTWPTSGKVYKTVAAATTAFQSGDTLYLPHGYRMTQPGGNFFGTSASRDLKIRAYNAGQGTRDVQKEAAARKKIRRAAYDRNENAFMEAVEDFWDAMNYPVLDYGYYMKPDDWEKVTPSELGLSITIPDGQSLWRYTFENIPNNPNSMFGLSYDNEYVQTYSTGNKNVQTVCTGNIIPTWKASWKTSIRSLRIGCRTNDSSTPTTATYGYTKDIVFGMLEGQAHFVEKCKLNPNYNIDEGIWYSYVSESDGRIIVPTYTLVKDQNGTPIVDNKNCYSFRYGNVPTSANPKYTTVIIRVGEADTNPVTYYNGIMIVKHGNCPTNGILHLTNGATADIEDMCTMHSVEAIRVGFYNTNTENGIINFKRVHMIPGDLRAFHINSGGRAMNCGQIALTDCSFDYKLVNYSPKEEDDKIKIARCRPNGETICTNGQGTLSNRYCNTRSLSSSEGLAFENYANNSIANGGFGIGHGHAVFTISANSGGPETYPSNTHIKNFCSLVPTGAISKSFSFFGKNCSFDGVYEFNGATKSQFASIRGSSNKFSNSRFGPLQLWTRDTAGENEYYTTLHYNTGITAGTATTGTKFIFNNVDISAKASTTKWPLVIYGDSKHPIISNQIQIEGMTIRATINQDVFIKLADETTNSLSLTQIFNGITLVQDSGAALSEVRYTTSRSWPYIGGGNEKKTLASTLSAQSSIKNFKKTTSDKANQGGATSVTFPEQKIIFPFTWPKRK